MNLFQLCLLRGGLALLRPWIIFLHCIFTFVLKPCVNTSSTGYSGNVKPSLQSITCFLHRNVINSWTHWWFFFFPEKNNSNGCLKSIIMVLQNCKIRTCKGWIFSQFCMLITLLHLEIQFFISCRWIEKSPLLLLGKKQNCGVSYDKYWTCICKDRWRMPNMKLHQMSSVNTTGLLHKSRVLSLQF